MGLLSMLGLERSTLASDLATEIVQALLEVDRLNAELDAGREEAQRLFAAGREEAQRLFAAGRARERELWEAAYLGGATQSWLDGE